MKSIITVILLLFQHGNNCYFTNQSSSPYQLKLGNYWIYESSSTNLAGKTVTKNLNDSLYIKKDTIINGNTFFNIQNPFGMNEFLTESSGNLYDANGRKVCAFNNTNDTLFLDKRNETIGIMNGEEEIKVPSGKFKAVVVLILQKNNKDNLNRQDPTFFSEQYSVLSKTWYAREIGMVKKINYYGNKSSFNLDLVKKGTSK